MPNAIAPNRSASLTVVVLIAIDVLLGLSAKAQSPVPFAWTDLSIPSTNVAPAGPADFDGDGAPDLVVAGPQPYVLRNDGHGHFSGPAAPSGPAGVASPNAIADFNGDGRADVAVLDGGTVTAWFGAALGFLAVGTPIAVPGAASIAAGDLNGDGAADLVIGTLFANPGGQPPQLPGSSIVLMSNGAGGFSSSGSLGLPQLGNAGLVLVDVDHDGDLDLAVTAGGALGVVFNTGGAFGNAVGVPVGSGGTPTVPKTARLNNDLYPDLIACSPSNPVQLFIGGPGGFTPFGPGAPSSAVAVSAAADLNLDGIDEVITPGKWTTVAYSVGPAGALTPFLTLVRSGGAVLAGDLDADGDPDVVIHEQATRVNTEYLTDAAGGLHEQGPACQPRLLIGGPIPADVNGDGAPDLVGMSSQGGINVLAIATNDGVGRFSWSTATPAGPPLGGTQVVLAALDFDGDGDQDLASFELMPLNLGFTGALRTITNAGGGAWTASAATPLPGFIGRCDLAVADMNGDGIDDLIVGTSYDGTRICSGSPAGLVLPGTNIYAGGAGRFALGDLDLDGDVDILVTNSGAYVLFNQGGGSFVAVNPFMIPLSVPPIEFASLADVNGDGFLDVYLNYFLSLHSGNTWVPYAAIPVPVNTGVPHVRSFDFEGDGDIDTILGTGFAYVDEGGGSVTTHSLPVNVGNQYLDNQYLVLVDLDRDGDLDVVSSTAGPIPVGGPDRTFAVLFNTARQLSLDAPARPGHTCHLGLRGAPGGTWFLFASTGLASLALPPYGTVLIDPAAAIQIGTGSLDAAGKADAAIPLPASFSSYLGVEFDAQGFVDTVAGPRITNARRVVVSGY